MRILRLAANDDAHALALHRELDRQLAPLSAAPARHEIVTLAGAEATRARLHALYHPAEPAFDLVVGTGHGARWNFSNQRTGPLIGSDLRCPTIQKAVVFLVSCRCGDDLGALIVSWHRARAFVGYNHSYYHPFNPAWRLHFVAEPAAAILALARGEGFSAVKAAADLAHAAAREALVTAGAPADELARLDKNHRSLVGPWSDPDGKFGRLAPV